LNPNNIIISIITATYNAEKHLQKLIDSIIPQKNSTIEFLIIDGKSSDKTLDIIAKNEKHIDFWISEPDNGVYDAWNKAIKVAKGKWLMFIGADDILNGGSISIYLDYIHTNDLNDVDYISATNDYVDENNQFLKVIGEHCTWEKMHIRMCAAHVASLHRRKLFDEVGLYLLDFKICADYELLLRKRENLNSRFINVKIAQMQIGGISFSHKALNEIYKIRKLHNTLPMVQNVLYYFISVFLFSTFRIRKKIINLF